MLKIKKRAIRSFHLFYWAMWANCSGPSPKMSNHERFAQVAHHKWANERISCFFERFAQVAHQKRATKSKVLRSLTKNERITVFFAHFFAKTSDSLRKPMSEFPALILTIALTAQSSRKETVLFLLFTWIRIRSEEDDLQNADQDPKPCILFNSMYRYQQKTTTHWKSFLLLNYLIL